MSNLLSPFTPGASLTTDGKPVVVRVRAAGEVTVRSGRLLLADPELLEPLPYVRTVAPGRYPVLLAVEERPEPRTWDEHVVSVLVRLGNSAPLSWELALREGQDARLLRPASFYAPPRTPAYRQFFAFLDAEGEAVFKSAGRVLKAGLEKMPSARVRCTQEALPGDGLNVVMWDSIRVPTSWWGLDAAGVPVCLVLDSGFLDLERPRMGGDVAARQKRIRLRIEEVRLEGASVDPEVVSELGDYGGEAAEAIDLLLALAAAEGERDCWFSKLLGPVMYAAGRICEEAPEHVARVAEALDTARSGGAAAGLLAVVYAIRGDVAKPLLPHVLRYLGPGYSEDVYDRAWEALRQIAWGAAHTLPGVMEAARRMPQACKFSVLYTLRELLRAGGHADIGALLAVIDPVTSDGDDHLQEAQMDLLGYLGLDKPEVASRILTLLDSHAGQVGTLTWAHIESNPVQRAQLVGSLLKTLEDERFAWQRSAALYHLAALRHGDPRIAPVLQRLMESGPEPLRQWTREAIEDNPPPSLQAS